MCFTVCIHTLSMWNDSQIHPAGLGADLLPATMPAAAAGHRWDLPAALVRGRDAVRAAVASVCVGGQACDLILTPAAAIAAALLA